MPSIPRALGAAIVLALAAGGGAHAADLPHLISAAQLKAQVQHPTNGLAIASVAMGAGATVLAVRRTRTGEVEMHEGFNDVLVAQSGRAGVLIGDRLEGGRQTAAGEWRGGVIPGGQVYQLAPGDMIWIPAGQPHQIVTRAGGDFRYLAFKYPVQPQ